MPTLLYMFLAFFSSICHSFNETPTRKAQCGGTRTTALNVPKARALTLTKNPTGHRFDQSVVLTNRCWPILSPTSWQNIFHLKPNAWQYWTGVCFLFPTCSCKNKKKNIVYYSCLFIKKQGVFRWFTSTSYQFPLFPLAQPGWESYKQERCEELGVDTVSPVLWQTIDVLSLHWKTRRIPGWSKVSLEFII